jgi:phage terminase large subunit-like protein
MTTEEIYALAGHLPEHELRFLIWHLKRREAQTPPDPLPYIWFLLGGRYSGKTVTASNHIFEVACTLPYTPENRSVRVALVGETAGDVKKTMVEGLTGLLKVIPEEMVLAWNRSQGELTVEVPQGYSVPERREIRFTSYSSESPNQLRGPNFHLAWIDEPAKLRDADEDPQKAGTTFSNLTLSTRVGRPHIIVSGTPTPCRLVRYLRDHPRSVVHLMRSRDNAANVDETVIEEWDRIAPASRTARQELDAEILEDNPEAVFFQDIINSNRAGVPDDARDYAEVLGWDPSMTSGEDSDDAGIILTGWTPERRDGGKQSGKAFTSAEAYVLADLSGRYTPTEQTRLVIHTVLEREVADLVFESNQGADFVLTQIQSELTAQTIEPPTRRELRSKALKYGALKRYRFRVVKEDGTPFSFVVNAIHAMKGKQLRAEVAAMKYDSGQVHHPPEGLLTLEKEMTGWSPLAKKSPDRVDAVTYTLLHIFGAKQMMRHSPARLIGPVTTPGRLVPADGPGNRAMATVYSMDIMDRRGPS